MCRLDRLLARSGSREQTSPDSSWRQQPVNILQQSVQNIEGDADPVLHQRSLPFYVSGGQTAKWKVELTSARIPFLIG
jgi:hypothetical protein